MVNLFWVHIARGNRADCGQTSRFPQHENKEYMTTQVRFANGAPARFIGIWVGHERRMPRQDLFNLRA